MLKNALREAINRFLGKTVVDEKAVKSLIKEIQRILIASDVDVSLVLSLSKSIEKRVLKEERPASMTLREYVIKVVYDELVKIVGKEYKPRTDKHKVMLVGLYGSGKTTTAAKLGLFYKKLGLSVLLVGADVDRPAAKDQLKQLSEKINVDFCTSEGSSKDIVKNCIKKKVDIIIVDTAGRNALDEGLKKELKEIYDVLKPEEVFLVVSADIGHLSKVQAKGFSEAIPISGVIITKMDGSGKAGGALTSVAEANAKIAFIGTGEKLEDLELFDPQKFVSRLLGMPDVKAVIEKFEKENIKIDVSDEFNLQTFYEQLKATQQMGPLSSILSNLGFSAKVPDEMLSKSELQMKRFKAIIESMTLEERKHPEIVRKSSSRVERIAKGSGTKPEEVRALINQFFKMEKMFNQFKKNRSLRAKLERMFKGGNLPI